MDKASLSIAISDIDTDACTLNFTLLNNNQPRLQFDKLCFTFLYALDYEKFINVKQGYHSGTYFEFEPLKNQDLLAGHKWRFSVRVKINLRHYSDMPDGFFIVKGNICSEVIYDKAAKLSAKLTEDQHLAQLKCNQTYSDAQNVQQISKRLINCFPMPNNIKYLSYLIDLSNGFKHCFSDEFKGCWQKIVDIEKDFSLPDSFFYSNRQGTRLNVERKKTIVTAGYHLSITSAGVKIFASDVQGVQHALMSLWQIAVLNPSEGAALEIVDAPRFPWRAQHLDTARQFYSVTEIKRLLNQMALYKLNKFHWHLVDDEAWRIEIKAIPQLCKQISQRGYNQLVEPQCGSSASSYGGYYSQDEVCEIVSYAAQRNIEVIPEIDIPGHCYALLKIMPELLEEKDESDYKSAQGYKNNCLNPAVSATYIFLETVFKEIADLFPGQYIHIGADERAEESWKKSKLIAALMLRHGFTSSQQVQCYFLNKVQKIIADLGKKTGAWEEATEQGDIDKDSYIISWKGVQAGLSAAARGYSVVMAPAQFCYFDIAQSEDWDEPGLAWVGSPVDLQTTYNFDPVPCDFAIEHAQNIMGIQGCLWSENLYDKSIFEYQLYPRLIALSEVGWTSPQRKNFPSFINAIKLYHLPLLSALNIDYRHRGLIP